MGLSATTAQLEGVSDSENSETSQFTYFPHGVRYTRLIQDATLRAQAVPCRLRPQRMGSRPTRVDGSVLLDKQRCLGGGHPSRGEVPLQGTASFGHGRRIPAERPKLLGGGAAVPRHSALLCLAVLPEQQADLQRMNRRCDDR